MLLYFLFMEQKLLLLVKEECSPAKVKKIWKSYQLLHNMGKNPKEAKYFLEVIGLKYKISNLQAALGESQLDKIDYIIKMKKRIFNNYKKF